MFRSAYLFRYNGFLKLPWRLPAELVEAVKKQETDEIEQAPWWIASGLLEQHISIPMPAGGLLAIDSMLLHAAGRNRTDGTHDAHRRLPRGGPPRRRVGSQARGDLRRTRVPRQRPQAACVDQEALTRLQFPFTRGYNIVNIACTESMTMADPTDAREDSGPGDGWHNVSQQGVPPVAWDANNKCFVVTLKGVALNKLDDPHAIGVQIQFRPPVLYDVRVREKGSTEWGVGFIVPMNSLGFSGWKPDTDYEVMIRQVDKSGKIVSDSKPYLSGFHSPKSNE